MTRNQAPITNRVCAGRIRESLVIEG